MDSRTISALTSVRVIVLLVPFFFLLTSFVIYEWILYGRSQEETAQVVGLRTPDIEKQFSHLGSN